MPTHCRQSNHYNYLRTDKAQEKEKLIQLTQENEHFRVIMNFKCPFYGSYSVFLKNLLSLWAGNFL